MKTKSFVPQLRKILMSAAAVCILSTGTAYAAEITDITMFGWEALPQETRGYFEAGIKDIPDEVIKLYALKGGKVHFMDGVLASDGHEEPAVRGLYWIKDHKIELAVGEDREPAYIQITAAHEFGHFLYSMTYSQWSDQSKEQLKNNFAYWSQYTFDCTDERETFAYLYSMYRAINDPYLSRECIAMLQEAEDICSWTYSRFISGEVIGPGMILEWQEKTEAGDPAPDLEAGPAAQNSAG